MKVETPARETLPRHKRPFSFGQVIVLFLLITAAGPFAVTLCSVTILLFAFSHPKEYQMRHAPPGIVDPLKDIMYGLGYPAVLGTGLVFLALHIAKLPNGVWAIDDPVSCLAIAAGSFYTLSFTALSETEEEKTKLSYRWPAFIVDVFEVGLMFCCFYFLGLMEGKDAAPNYPIVYGTLIVDVIIVQPVWRLVAGIKVSAYLVDRVVATTM